MPDGARVRDLSKVIAIQLAGEALPECRDALLDQLAAQIARAPDPGAALEHARADLGVRLVRALGAIV